MGDGNWAEVRERIFVWATCSRRRLPRLPPPLEAPAHRDGGDQRLVRADPVARALEPLDFDVEDEGAIRLGSGTVADMTWKQMVDTMSWTECGRCQDVCPAYATAGAVAQAPA